MSRNKARGTAFETAIVDYLNTHGFPYAERRAQHGTNDRGDIAGLPGVVIEAKNCQRLELAAWMDEAEQERKNAGAHDCYVIVKRRGKNIAQAYVVQTVAQWAQDKWLTDGGPSPIYDYAPDESVIEYLNDR